MRKRISGRKGSGNRDMLAICSSVCGDLKVVWYCQSRLFVAEGKSIAAFTNPDVRVTDRIHIYEKPNEEHFNYKFLTTVEEPSNTSSMGLPLGGGGVYDDVLKNTKIKVSH